MAGRIRAEDVLAVKERASLEDVVRQHVTLRRVGSRWVGLCPFHDEKTGSFTVNPTSGYYKCFGCGEGGDVFSFLEKVEHLSFAETVERLAATTGVELHYEDGGAPGDRAAPGRRARLVEAHRVAQEFYAERLFSPEARVARDFMRERAFDSAVARRFGVGFAPRAGEELVRHLRVKGFLDDELAVAGLAVRSQRGTGVFDRFRGRLVWPIRDLTGDVVGFGARRLFADDRIEAKYLNTAETPIYKKSTVLYGLDSAKKAIAAQRVAVVVEGYTDVMACHLAGVETAVASCGTAFGPEHVKVLRRIMRDEPELAPARVVFTFDGDAAGQAAAMKAFKDDQRWASQSYVAVEPTGKDPCELRQAEGDQAVRALVEGAVPMFEFAVRTTIGRFDLDTAEGRVLAMRAVAPIVAEIRDAALRPEYVRTVAGWLGVDVEQVAAEVRRVQRAPRPTPRSDLRDGPPAGERRFNDPDEATVAPTPAELAAALPTPDLRDPVVNAERQLLQCLLQFPSHVPSNALAALRPEAFTAPAHQAVYAALAQVGAPGDRSAAGWHAAIAAAAPAAALPILTELAVAPLPVILDPLSGAPEQRYVESLLLRVHEVRLRRLVADTLGRLRRLDAGEADPAATRELSRQLQQWQRELAALRDREEA